ncbi:MAG: hypothetical protein K9L26_04720 [Candidatus Izimaplasma sp.]|nr:hypothetical protein [Candidatus Izimaplasma bacterium]
MKRKMLDKLITQYNHLIDYTILIEDPSFLDVFKAGMPYYDESIKPNRFIGALFLILCELHDLDDADFIDVGLRKLRTVSYQKELNQIMDNIFHKVLDNLVENTQDDGEFLIEEVWELLHEYDVYELTEIPEENAFAQFYLLQDNATLDLELIDLVEDLIFDLYDSEIDNYETLAYNLLLICPYAHSGMSMFLNVVKMTGYKQLLNVIIRAFELIHKEDLMKHTPRFYYHENYRDYILALESLALLHKWEGDFESSKTLYEKALQYDDLDVLDIKESILLPLLATGDFEAFLDQASELKDGIFKAYVDLFNGLIDAFEPLDYGRYEKAYQASPLIMEMLCTEEDLYDKASIKERKYLDDFYSVWQMQQDILDHLKEIYFKRTIS